MNHPGQGYHLIHMSHAQTREGRSDGVDFGLSCNYLLLRVPFLFPPLSLLPLSLPLHLSLSLSLSAESAGEAKQTNKQTKPTVSVICDRTRFEF